MEIKVDIKSGSQKKEPIDTAISFPVTQSQKLAIEQIKKNNKSIDVNFTIRQCLDQIIKQCQKVS